MFKKKYKKIIGITLSTAMLLSQIVSVYANVTDCKTEIASSSNASYSENLNEVSISTSYNATPSNANTKENFIENKKEIYKLNSTLNYNLNETTTSVSDCVAIIDETEYGSFSEAISAANSFGSDVEIILMDDVVIEEKFTISNNITINGNDHSITRGDSYKGNFFTINSNCALTLNGNLMIDGNNDWEFDEDGYFEALNNGIRISNVSQFVIPENEAPVATADMFIINGSVIVENTTIVNHVGTSGNGIFSVNANAKLTMNDGTLITHCTQPNSSVVASVAKNALWTINEGVEISNNHGGSNGGICRSDSGKIIMNGGEVINNTAVNTNGTFIMLYGAGSEFEMNGGKICSNTGVIGTSNGRNAAVYLHSASTMNMTGGTICCNEGTSRGGIDSYRANSTLRISGGNVIDNVSHAGNENYDVGHNGNFDNWYITGGIYTQDLDNYCYNGYVCIPNDESEREDDFIVVKGYRVSYYSVEDNEETTDDLTDNLITLVNKELFPLNGLDWTTVDFYAVGNDVVDSENSRKISKWYFDEEFTTEFDFINTEILENIKLYGEWQYGTLIPISKCCFQNVGEESFDISIEEVEYGTWNLIRSLPVTTMTVMNENKTDESILLPTIEKDPGTYYYKINVVQDNKEILYDRNYFIVSVEVTEEESSVMSLLRNGTEEISAEETISFESEKIIRSIKGYIWNDENMDGIQNESLNSYINELKISLYKLIENGNPNNESDYSQCYLNNTSIPLTILSGQTISIQDETIEDAMNFDDGYYQFTDLEAGTYMIKIESNAGIDLARYRTSKINCGSDDTIDSDGDGKYIKNNIETKDESGRLNEILIKSIVMPEKEELTEAIYILENNDQGIYESTCNIVITKEVDYLHKNLGSTVFVFQIDGIDIDGNYRKWIKIIELDTDETTGTITLKNVPCSNEDGYNIKEIKTARYDNSEITGTNIIENSTDLQERQTAIDFYNYVDANVKFKNSIYIWNKFSDADVK